MRRFLPLVLMISALALVGSLGTLDAQNEVDHPFTTEWCSSPVIIPLASADALATTTAPGVATARGAAPVISSRGPAIRMTETGSRVQVSFGQTLFHTQWLFGSIDEGDSVRADAFLGNASLPIEAASARGALIVAPEQSNLGFTAESRARPRSTGQIDVFQGATEVLFTNEGDTPVDLIAAIGCPALEVQTEVLSAPAWDADLQRFVAEHEITFRNRLSNARTNALTTQYTGAADTVIEDVLIDLVIGADGFRSAEIDDVELSRELDRRRNLEFDGSFDVSLLETPLRLSDGGEQKISFTVSYEPNFNDPTWSEGVSVPSPTVTLRGRVDDVAVGVTARSRPEGAELDATTSPNRLETPEPGLVVEHRFVEEPESSVDGNIELSEQITITNNGDTAVEELVVSYAVADMYGEGTVLTSVNGRGASGCVGSFSSGFDGSQRAVVAFDGNGLGVGATCEINLSLQVRPGLIPTSAGQSYEAPVVATARSGAREVRDAVTVESTIAQSPQLSIELGETEVTNLEDGRYRFEGDLTIENTGDQNLNGVAARVDFTTSLVETVPANVVFTEIGGQPRCPSLEVPNDLRSGAALTASVELAPTRECTVSYSVTTRPGATLDGWEVTASAEAFSARGVAVEIEQDTAELELLEAPAISSSTSRESITNNRDGSYRFNVVTEITNTGDTPLTTITTSDSGAEVFGASLIVSERVASTCSLVTPEQPLRAASQPNGPYSCTVTEQYVVAPGAQLTDWMIESTSEATSTSGARVSSSAELAAPIQFTEAPRLESDVELVSIEKVDNRNVRLVLVADLENTGDIEVRRVQAELDLDDALEGAPFVVEAIGADGVIATTTFNGKGQTRLLEGNDELAADGTGQIRLVLLAETGSNSGPFTFELETTAISPSTAQLEVATAITDRTVPIVQVIDRALLSTNNNDGTYELSHSVTARNQGRIDVPRIAVFTDFEAVFGNLVIGEIETSSTCGSSVGAGATCTSTRSATVRPGSATGPYEVAVNISAADQSELVALVLPEPQGVLFDARANADLRFQERPSIVIETDVDNIVNNNDGTYSLDYRAEVTNAGDVPLYRVGVSDFAAVYGEAAIGNTLGGDTCLAVSFESPLGPAQQCTRSQSLTIRPGTTLGPWNADTRVTGETPTFATVLQDSDFESVAFEETVAIEATSSVTTGRNNGNGTYNVNFELEVTNTSNVPLVSVVSNNGATTYGDALISEEVSVDSCSIVGSGSPLLPGEQCRVALDQLLEPGSELGPFEVTSNVVAQSTSSETAEAETTTDSLTLTEAPRLSLQTEVASVENVDPETFRVVTNMTIENRGDVRVDDLSVILDLDELFPDSTYRIDGAISNDLVINEAFAAEESQEILDRGQALSLGSSGTITLILSVEAEDQTGPFVGELRVAGSSPADNDVAAVINAQIDLPSIAVAVVAQSSDNNRDGSYTVTTSYEIQNDGSAALEFVRLTEDIAAIYEGTNARTISIESDDLPVLDLEERRGVDLLEWGVSLPAGESAIVTTTVLIEPGNVLGPFVPIGGTSATSPAGTPVEANGFAPEEIEFVEQPALRVNQRLLSRPEWNGSGTFDVSFAIDVTNDGDVELRSLQVREDLLNALGTGSRITVRDVRSETLAVNSNFDGRGQPPRVVDPLTADADAGEAEAEEPRAVRDIGDTRLLAGWDTLPAGETGTIEVDLRITPEERGVYSTRVGVSALTPAGTDLGSNGDIIEANTLTRLSVQGELGVAKQTIGEPTVRPDGSISVTYEILVENAGPFPLDNVEVHDQLSQAFGVGSTFVTSRVRIEAASPCEGHASSSYDGGTIDPVLVSGVELNPGQQCRIQYDAVVIPSNALPGPFRSSAFAIGSDPFSGTVIDDSTDGTNTDPDGNQEPGDNDIATSVRVTVPEPSAEIAVVPLEAGPLDSDDWYEFGFAVSLTNTGSIDIDTTRLVAALDDEWSVPYEVLSVTSDDLIVNDSFNGENNDNLLQRRNRLRAGATAVVDVVVRAPEPRSGELTMPATFRGESVTGTPIVVEQSEQVAALTAQDSIVLPWLDTLSQEEQRLLLLGSLAILLFVLVFLRRVYKRVARIRKTRAARRAEAEAREELFIDLTEAQERKRMRAHAPEIDLTGDADSNDEVIVEHYSPRRRRGRRPTDSPRP